MSRVRRHTNQDTLKFFGPATPLTANAVMDLVGALGADQEVAPDQDEVMSDQEGQNGAESGSEVEELPEVEDGCMLCGQIFGAQDEDNCA